MSLFQSADFRWLFLAKTVSNIGNDLAPLALSFAVLSVTDSAAALGYVLAAQSFPLVGLLLVGGVVSDRVSRKKLMVAMDVAKSFGQSQVFGIVLLFLLGGIGYLVLGFGNYRYVGPANALARSAVA